MDRKIRIGAVSYLNTKPLIYGMEQGMMKDQIELSLDTPANLARQLLNDEIDCGLVPVAVIPSLPEYHFISDYGICCDGEVASVCIFSECPIEEIECLLLDYQSRTSVQLARVLLENHWKLYPKLVHTTEDFRNQIKGKTAAVLIGDRAMRQRKVSAYVYDLGWHWKEWTGLPFVFATWVSNKALPAGFVKAFAETNAFGLENLQTVIEKYQPFESFDLHRYYSDNILFRLTAPMYASIERFLHLVGNLNVLAADS